MKAEKGNCFVVMDRSDYNEKMEALLSDHLTYQLVQKSPFAKIERELNHMLLDLKNKNKFEESIYRKLLSTDAILPAIRGSIKHHKPGYPSGPLFHAPGQLYFSLTSWHPSRTAMVALSLIQWNLLIKSPT